MSENNGIIQKVYDGTLDYIQAGTKTVLSAFAPVESEKTNTDLNGASSVKSSYAKLDVSALSGSSMTQAATGFISQYFAESNTIEHQAVVGDLMGYVSTSVRKEVDSLALGAQSLLSKEVSGEEKTAAIVETVIAAIVIAGLGVGAVAGAYSFLSGRRERVNEKTRELPKQVENRLDELKRSYPHSQPAARLALARQTYDYLANLLGEEALDELLKPEAINSFSLGLGGHTPELNSNNPIIIALEKATKAQGAKLDFSEILSLAETVCEYFGDSDFIRALAVDPRVSEPLLRGMLTSTKVNFSMAGEVLRGYEDAYMALESNAKLGDLWAWYRAKRRIPVPHELFFLAQLVGDNHRMRLSLTQINRKNPMSSISRFDFRAYASMCELSTLELLEALKSEQRPSEETFRLMTAEEWSHLRKKVQNIKVQLRACVEGRVNLRVTDSIFETLDMGTPFQEFVEGELNREEFVRYLSSLLVVLEIESSSEAKLDSYVIPQLKGIKSLKSILNTAKMNPSSKQYLRAIIVAHQLESLSAGSSKPKSLLYYLDGMLFDINGPQQALREELASYFPIGYEIPPLMQASPEEVQALRGVVSAMRHIEMYHRYREDEAAYLQALYEYYGEIPPALDMLFHGEDGFYGKEVLGRIGQDFHAMASFIEVAPRQLAQLAESIEGDLSQTLKDPQRRAGLREAVEGAILLALDKEQEQIEKVLQGHNPEAFIDLMESLHGHPIDKLAQAQLVQSYEDFLEWCQTDLFSRLSEDRKAQLLEQMPKAESLAADHVVDVATFRNFDEVWKNFQKSPTLEQADFLIVMAMSIRLRNINAGQYGEAFQAERNQFLTAVASYDAETGFIELPEHLGGSCERLELGSQHVEVLKAAAQQLAGKGSVDLGAARSARSTSPMMSLKRLPARARGLIPR